jgi:hypothetical protein
VVVAAGEVCGQRRAFVMDAAVLHQGRAVAAGALAGGGRLVAGPGLVPVNPAAQATGGATRELGQQEAEPAREDPE